MKKLLFSLMLAIAPLGVFAQPHLSQDILAVPAIGIGTNGSGAAGWTNLSLLTTNAGMVYGTNIVYTNSSGVQVRGFGVTNGASTAKLFNNVQLYSDREGQPIHKAVGGVVAGINIAGESSSNFLAVSSQTLVIEVVNNQATNGPIGFVFAPVWDDTVVTSGRADDWAVVLPGLAAGKYTVKTNVPTWLWPGAKSFTLRYSTNFHDSAGLGAITNGTFITAMKVVGFRP